MNPTTQLNEILVDKNGWIPSGYVWFKCPITDNKMEGDFVIVQLGWIGLKELTALKEFAKQKGWRGFNEGVFSPQANEATKERQVDAPLCPRHKKPMRQSNFNNEFICPCRDQGGYCSKVATMSGDGSWLIK